MADSLSSDDSLSTPGSGETRGRDDATYRVRSRESVTEAVVRAASSETGTDRIELPPLYSTVDPDALNRLFAHSDSGSTRRPNAVIGFTFAGQRVRVKSDGTITVDPPDGR